MVNIVYFSDAYGLKKIDISNLVGESQTVVTRLFSTASTPSIPDNAIDSIHGEYVDGNSYIVFSFTNAIGADAIWGNAFWGDIWAAVSGTSYLGCYVAKNEASLEQYADGYKVLAPKINNRGILYLINRNHNTIEVYYGIHVQPGSRAPDFIYSTTSTPALFPGQIVSLHIVNDASSELAGGTRLYIGTSLGITRIDAFDVEGPVGYCAGLDSYGLATTYSISGGGATYEIIGGSIPGVVAISSDEDNGIMLVATGDGYGNGGGITQISMNTNRRTAHMTYEGGFIPSNDIRNIANKVI